MTALAVVVGLAVLAVLGAVVVLLLRVLRTMEGIERAVWHVGDELRGGVGLRIGKSRSTRPDARGRPQADVADLG